MSRNFEVHGADDFLKLSKALKAAGQKELRKELHTGMRQAAKPLVKVAKREAGEVFPKRGGLAAQEAKVPFRAQVRTGATAGVRIVAPGKYLVAKSANATGSFRHPVFDTGTWVTQRLPGSRGWFDDAMSRNAPAVRKDLEQAVNSMINKVKRGV